ncbi:MAG: trigger factor, partial [Bacteroidales bacterium]|nr:trigger factor [Bacteroidales bacterium]
KKKARIDGFRPGHVPLGLISKLYYVPTKVEEINKVINEAITRYIQDEKIKILGEPLPRRDENNDIDWDHQETFDFSFDLGLSPEINLAIDKKIKIPYYQITIDDKLIGKHVDELCRRFGNFVVSDTIEKEEMVRGTFTELGADGQTLPKGLVAEDVILGVDIIKDESIRESFIGKHVGDSLRFEIRKAFPNDPDLINMLKIDKAKLSQLKPEFQFIIKEIKKFEPSAVDQQLFDKVYGEGNVKGEEEFKERVKKEIQDSLDKECEYRFTIDSRHTILENTKFDLPVDFLKRWMIATNENKITEEQIDKEFSLFEEDLKWHLIVNKITEVNEIKASAEDIKEYAKNIARNQYLRYGLSNVPDEHIEHYAEEILKKDDEKRRAIDQLLEEKTIGWIKMNVSIEDKEVDIDTFNKLYEK